MLLLREWTSRRTAQTTIRELVGSSLDTKLRPYPGQVFSTLQAATFCVHCLGPVLHAIHGRLLVPHPLLGIPCELKSVKCLMGDAPDELLEVSETREVSRWSARQVVNFNVPLCQVSVEPFSLPRLLLADSAEAQNIVGRQPRLDRPSTAASTRVNAKAANKTTRPGCRISWAQPPRQCCRPAHVPPCAASY